MAHVLNTSVRRLYYVLIYASDNEILFMLYLFELMQQHLYLSCERLCMAELDDCNILQPGHLVESRLGGCITQSAFKTSVSHDFTCSSSQATCRATKEPLP
jgi:hypothetical protein